MNDLLVLLRQDLSQTFRLRGGKGKRTEQKHIIRRLIGPIAGVIVAVAIIWAIVILGPIIWPFVEEVLQAEGGLGLGATIFNALMLFGFLGSIMVSATTVGNSERMEYLMTMPIALRTLFLEKTIIIILYNSIIWLVIGTPIFIGFSIVSPYPFAFLSAPLFLILMLILVALGVSLGGLLGLIFSRILAGRRMLKQVGYAIMSSLGILAGTFWYISIYTDQSGEIFGFFFEIANMLGLSSNLTPGYAVSVLTLGTLIGAPFTFFDVIVPLIYAAIAFSLVYATALVSEEAHYSGWMASGSKRSSKVEVKIGERRWDPQPFKWLTFNNTVSVSLWYNIASIRREARVFTQYLIGPIRYIIWLILPVFIAGEEAFGFTSYFIVAALIPFATSYGLFFAGYETVYEGKNLMTLQLAATNMQDYVKGKALSAVPFSLAASIVMSVIIAIISPDLVIYLPAMVASIIFLTLASGAVAANAAAMGGDFKAERNITRQRGSAVRMPITGWSILRAQFLPMILGFAGVFAVLLVGIFLNPLLSYLAAPAFMAVCYIIYRNYSRSAGIKLAQIEATKYL